MAAGTPVIASDLPVVRALAENGREALLVRPGSAKAIKDAAIRLVMEPDLGRRLRCRGPCKSGGKLHMEDRPEMHWWKRYVGIQMTIAAATPSSFPSHPSTSRLPPTAQTPPQSSPGPLAPFPRAHSGSKHVPARPAPVDATAARGIRNPFRPCSITSGIPPASLAMAIFAAAHGFQEGVGQAFP